MKTENNNQVSQTINISEEELISWLKYYLNFGNIINDEFPSKGASSWYPYGYALISNILNLASHLLIKHAGYKEIILPSFVHGDDFMKECKNIKDFSERVYWSPLYEKNDLHVVTPTIEAQLGAMYTIWLKKRLGKLPFRYFTIRSVGRYETGKTIPLWKERNVWPFFEGLTAHRSKSDFNNSIKKQVDFMKKFFSDIGIPVVIVERPKIHERLKEYSERRIEAITITKDKRIVILANIYDLGEIFSKVYDISYMDAGNKEYVLTSAIGLSGRVLAALLVITGDENGFILPPSTAPIKLAILPISMNSQIRKLINNIKNNMNKKGIRTEEFYSSKSLGERRTKVTAMGVPFILEIGKNEVDSLKLNVRIRGTNEIVASRINNLAFNIEKQEKRVEKLMKKKAQRNFNKLTKDAKTKSKFLDFLEDDLLTRAPFCDNANCYNHALSLCKKELIGRDYIARLDRTDKCIFCRDKAKQILYFGVKWKGEK